MKNPKHKTFLLALSAGIVAAVLAAILSVPTAGTPLMIAISEIGVLMLRLMLVYAIVCVVYALLRTIDKNTVKNWFALQTKRINAQTQLSNTKNIVQHLQPFMYHVLTENNSTLNLPLGKDMSCLLAPGNRAYYRREVLVFRFALISPSAPEMENSTLRQLIQAHIETELTNYGMPVLDSHFNSRLYGWIPSVYLDRVLYNEAQRTLFLDVIFINREETATYVVNARKRDAAPAHGERAVFDSDL